MDSVQVSAGQINNHIHPAGKFTHVAHSLIQTGLQTAMTNLPFQFDMNVNFTDRGVKSATHARECGQNFTTSGLISSSFPCQEQYCS